VVSGKGGLVKTTNGILTLGNTANTYSGGTAISGGTLLLAADDSAGTGPIAIGYGTVLGGTNGFSLDPAIFAKITPSSMGVAALTADTWGGTYDMRQFPALRLGAIGTVTFGTDITPNGQTYRLGGGGGTLTVSSLLADDSETPRRLDVGLNGTAAGTVVLSADNT
jgi:fibronectin-binding autotransporter adhesin